MSDKTVIQNAIWAFMFQQFSKKSIKKKASYHLIEGQLFLWMKLFHRTSVTSFEFIDTSSCINELNDTSKEWV